MYSIIAGAALASALTVAYILYQVCIAPRFNPLRNLCGPPVRGLWGNHMDAVLK